MVQTDGGTLHSGALAAVSRFFFSNSKKNLPIFFTDCVSLHKKSRLFSINIERVIKCFVFFHEIFMTFIYIFFCFSDKWAEQDKKIKELLKHMYLQCFLKFWGPALPIHFFTFSKKIRKM